MGGWWAWVDSNYRPPAYQADALTGLSYRPFEMRSSPLERPRPALGPRKTNDVRRRLRVIGPKLPRLNESPGEPGIHSFAAIRLAPVAQTELDLGFRSSKSSRVSLERR